MSWPNVDQRSACNMARKQTAKKKVSMKSFCSKLLDNVYAWMYGCVCMLEGCMYEGMHRWMDGWMDGLMDVSV